MCTVEIGQRSLRMALQLDRYGMDDAAAKI